MHFQSVAFYYFYHAYQVNISTSKSMYLIQHKEQLPPSYNFPFFIS